mmetsp:Transcript_4256/g.18978  ORF Transcript_4256/g.18978 Transcript_4256/m.18978 type:complete len:352 (+) Transcript_4256:1166-2221(+)
MPAVNTQTSANVESCARNSRTPGLSITVHTGSPRSPTHRADRSIRSASASAPIALAQSPPSNLPPRVVVEATNGTGSPGAIASSPSTPPRVPWRGSLCRVKRVVFAAASGVDSSGGTPPFTSWLYAQTRVSSKSRTTHRCLPDASRRNRSPTSRGVGGSGVPSFDLRPSTSTHALGAAPSSGATPPATTHRDGCSPATAPLSTRARGRRVGSSRPSRRGDGGSFSSPAFRATSTSRYSATTSSASSLRGSSQKSSSSEKPESDPRSIPAHSSSRNLADASSTSPGWTTKGFGSFASRSSPGGETTGARMAGVRGGTTAVASPGAATAAGDTGARHDACVSMAAGMHRAPAE